MNQILVFQTTSLAAAVVAPLLPALPVGVPFVPALFAVEALASVLPVGVPFALVLHVEEGLVQLVLVVLG